jgi:prolyl-tRNA synthetase
MLLETLREAPGDAEAVSHRLLARAGYLRRLASGIYSFLPLGLRSIRNIERIIRDELDRIGGQEVLMPALHPEEIWEASGRAEKMDEVLMRVRSRGGRFVLGPTHEEVVTALVDGEVSSYRDLPRLVYQIQTKFRDEARPRFGLLRTREFSMKDAYSFDADPEGMRATYQALYDAYCRIFDRCHLPYTPVEALAGAIGGDVNHEFMVPSPIGEDHFASCPGCGYAANLEAAEAGEKRQRAAEPEELARHHTPGAPGIDLVVEHFADRGLTADRMLKCLAAVDEGGKPVVLLVPGDREVRLEGDLRPFEDAEFDAHPALVKGYIGPMGLQEHGVRVVADPLIRSGGPWVTGANVFEHHVTGATLDRDFTVDEWRGLATVAAGDPCPRCAADLEIVQAVEAGHTFQLGTVYSAGSPGATYVDADGREQVCWMGCYGIGVGRLLAVVAESHHDEHGLAWPDEIAPFQVHLLALGAGRNPAVAAAADELYDELRRGGVDVLYDDRDVSPGVKFADADLLGMPTQLVVGGKGLARGVVERKRRRTGERDELALAEAVGQLTA